MHKNNLVTVSVKPQQITVISVKEQRVDGFSIDFYYCKVYSGRRETGVWKKLSNLNLKIIS